MFNLGNKSDNTPGDVGELTADEFNDILDELQNFVTASGQTLTGSLAANLFQMAISGTLHSGLSDFYVDSGAVNTITLATVGSFQPVDALYTGLKVRTIPALACTGPATLTYPGLGSKPIHNSSDGALSSGDYTTNVTKFTYREDFNSAAGAWMLEQTGSSIALPLAINQGGSGQITAPAAFDAFTVTAPNLTAAATTSIFASAGLIVNVTGNTGITGFGANTSGQIRIAVFSGSPTITNNNTSLILPGGTNKAINPGDVMLLIGKGGTNCKCAIFAPNLDMSFAAALSTNGYQKLPSGMIMQWGQTASIAVDDTLSVAFPINFPTACLNVTATGNHVPVTGISVLAQAYGWSTSHVTIANDGSQAGTITWHAIGH